MDSETIYQSTLDLIDHLSFSAEMKARLITHISNAFFDQYADDCQALTKAAVAEDTQKELADRLAGKDPDGSRQLAVFLGAAAITHTNYRQAGISDDVFYATMECFPRFVRETTQNEGHCAFDRGFWTWRQTACQLFALGTLEFEYRQLGEHESRPDGFAAGAPVLSVHIPSSAVLSEAQLQISYRCAETFFTSPAAPFCRFGPPKAILCGTWMLAPVLAQFLSDASGIRRFASDYKIYYEDPQDDSFYLWVFGKKDSPEHLPQKTSLQRAIKAHLQSGGSIGSAKGILLPNR